MLSKKFVYNYSKLKEKLDQLVSVPFIYNKKVRPAFPQGTEIFKFRNIDWTL